MEGKSIAIMGGTFDPIHYGHLVTAQAVKDKFGVEKVMFIPTGNPPHKAGKEVTESEKRYFMTVLATITNLSFEVSRIEIDRAGYTYTIDTIRELRKVFDEDTKIYFITGADAIDKILTWKDPEKLLKMCDFVAVTRPGYNKEELEEHIKNLEKILGGNIHFLEVPYLDISSSDLRERVMENKSIKYMLPEEVENYIYKFGLYRKKEF